MLLRDEGKSSENERKFSNIVRGEIVWKENEMREVLFSLPK